MPYQLPKKEKIISRNNTFNGKLNVTITDKSDSSTLWHYRISCDVSYEDLAYLLPVLVGKECDYGLENRTDKYGHTYTRTRNKKILTKNNFPSLMYPSSDLYKEAN
tara:strand:- start:1538 stop:1855 length:318 start_codon:yes stop_codon:yes gene_type:complete